jgi:hypothetical protein
MEAPKEKERTPSARPFDTMRWNIYTIGNDRNRLTEPQPSDVAIFVLGRCMKAASSH